MGFRDLWAYGVTTVPAREHTLLPRTLDSLAAAGFSDPYIFMDGVTEYRGSAAIQRKGTVVERGEPIRAFGNWLLGLLELYIRKPGYDRYAMFQDDVVFYKNLRTYLNKTPYPPRGYLNLYSEPFNEREAPNAVGFFEAPLYSKRRPPDSVRTQGGKGALALVFDFHAVEALLGDAYLFARTQDTTVINGIELRHGNIDGAVVQLMNRLDRREYVHNPSLCQHTGVKQSTVKPYSDLAPSMTFRGENHDALEMLPK